MLRLRGCGGTAPASVPALVRARLARRASSAAFAAATVASASSSSSALEELAAERRGHPLSLPRLSACCRTVLLLRAGAAVLPPSPHCVARGGEWSLDRPY